MPQVPKTHQQFLDAASIAEKTVQMTTAKPIENLTLQVANIASMEDRLSAMLTDKLSSSVAEKSAIQAHNNNQSNGPYQRQNYQQRPKTIFQQRKYHSPQSSSCQGCDFLMSTTKTSRNGDSTLQAQRKTTETQLLTTNTITDTPQTQRTEKQASTTHIITDTNTITDTDRNEDITTTETLTKPPTTDTITTQAQD
ncbi:uncharacterized protein [Mytilus edulis]|uniref:uncharacterized protein n=1 Tax=Mytilus edulis TaxID=6550 RepID=UPI0039EF5815